MLIYLETQARREAAPYPRLASRRTRESLVAEMQPIKDTPRALVRIGFDGRVHKTFRGTRAAERFAQEVRALRLLEDHKCPFVPRLLAADAENLKIITTNCGARADRVNADRQRELFAELEDYGVRHEDQDVRNITYDPGRGRFCLIDFEFSTILGGDPAWSLRPSPTA